MGPITVLAVLVALVVTSGCTTYTARMNDTGAFYYDGEYDLAREELDELVTSSSNEDIFLFLLERGKVRLASGMYDSAIVDLQAAEHRFDEIEGTISIGEMLSAPLSSATRAGNTSRQPTRRSW